MTFSRRAFDGESSPGIGRAAAVWPEFKREQVRRVAPPEKGQA
jgi:hypothetical protein